jgi:hypothetical protein
LLGVAEAEGEDGFVKKTLVHHLVEWGVDVVDRDGVEGETEDAIEPAGRD